jgi:hypothetical protein
MLVGRIRDSNLCYKAPAGMDNCQDLHVRVYQDQQVRIMSSAWLPTPEELVLLNAGQPIHLHIYGDAHPVVMLTVPED